MKLSKLTLCITLATGSFSVFAAQQEQNKSEEVERIEVTGSSIKRTSLEGDLPITVISKDEIDAAGISSAEQLMLQLNIASNSNDGLGSNAGIVGGEERGNNGASSANLRQQGAGSTLVLLNGRRVASHGLKGASVDLNSIPFAAIERVEVLRDGASAVYGTDAIGGVINFILKKDYQGVQLNGFTDITEAGGGNISRFSILGGTGDLNNDGYNIMATLSYKKVDILHGDERDFTNTFQPNRGLSPDTRGAPYASINNRGGGDDPTNPNYNLIGTGLVNPETGEANNVLNVLALPGQPGCDAIENMGVDTGALWNRGNETRSCSWDYPRASVLQQPVDSIDFVSRATFMLEDDTELFAELIGSEVTSKKVFEPNQITPWSIGTEGYYPSTGESYDYIVDALSDYYGADQLNIGAPIAYRWRCMDCGSREIETTTTAYKLQLGMEGTFGDWDYKAGLSRSTNEAESELGGGYHYTELLAQAIGSGAVNPFLLPGESQTQAGMDAINAASAKGVVLYGGKTTLTQIDASISGDTGFELGLGGDTIMVAAGVDLRREAYEFNGDRRAAEERPTIYGAPFDNGNELDDVHRDIKAVFLEALVPVTEQLEINLAARYDHYSGFGGTTNPKIGVKYKPFDELLFRGAYSTGFRAPSFNQLFNGVSEQPYTGTDLADPALCQGGVVDASDPNCQPISPVLIYGGKEDLGPEESKQSSFGFVWAPSSAFSLNLDWWEIITEGTIQTPVRQDLLDNPDLFASNFIRDESGALSAIDMRYINAGERNTSGVELGMQINGELGEGLWDIHFNGSYLIEDRKKLLDNVPFGDNLVGTHSRGNIPLRWKHSLAFNYAHGDWRHNVTQIFRDSYEDEVPAGIQSGAISINEVEDYSPMVSSYLIYNYSVSYTGFKDIGLTFGIKNLFDRDPPFTAHQNDYSPGAAFDPRVADPRGRAYTLNAEYRF
ncbi:MULTISPECIES: TonB-dependent receptor [unclassified Pseudoalteromonas]|jgi:iron complex outermembrane receptor protein|uniref:TonB-dependent receptor domain-containing protein n=1 Tax=unclassified Pseudoalteromonas TaxID=194690 RepID=UPI002580D7E2|nr:TonB-dependent receptor [Pseudoalteromonas sp.]|tara:strand:- start:1749 stop:4604 length:2856 start_codon:yes stop_codon:yes gene_type:complete